MPQVFILALSLLPWIPAFHCGVNTAKELAVLEGQSLTVPCHYEPQYASYVKYWCRGKTRQFCTSLARTDDPRSANPEEDRTSIFDDPVQLVFTVTMKDLKEEDSGWYMCGVEIGSAWVADLVAFTDIKVVHGMSVVNSHLSGEEGSSVTVECLYSQKYRESEKKWCRSGDWSSCVLTDSEGRYEDTSVAISDDRMRTFTITLKKLHLRDTGWYLCFAGQQQISVHVKVTPRHTTTPESVTLPPSQSVVYLPPPKPITRESWNSHSHILESLLVCGSLIVLIGMAIYARKLWKLHKQDPVQRLDNEMKARLKQNHSGEAHDLQNASVVFFNKDYEDAHMY